MSTSPFAPSLRRAPAILLVGALVCAALSGLSGCAVAGNGASAAGEVENVAVVVGACANQPPHAVASVADELGRAVASNGYADVVVADTTPSSAIGGAAQVGSTTTNPTRRAQEEQAILSSLTSACEQATADSAETDVLKALRCAASGLAGHGNSGPNVACVLHSGLTTSGVLDLAAHPEWIYADPDELASALTDQLPDLSVLSLVRWYDLGYTAGDQAEPDQVTLERLKALWSAVLRQAGVGAVEFVDTQAASGENPSAFPVSTVDLRVAEAPRVEVQAQEEAQVLEAEAAPQAATVTLDEVLSEDGTLDIPESEVGFVPDTADFLDEDAARAYLARLAQALTAQPDACVWLTGSCAGCPWDAGHGVELATRRARAVADLLVTLGVDPAQLQVEGVGDQSNERVQHVSDIAEDGVTQTDAAQQNRRVVVTRA